MKSDGKLSKATKSIGVGSVAALLLGLTLGGLPAKGQSANGQGKQLPYQNTALSPERGPLIWCRA